MALLLNDSLTWFALDKDREWSWVTLLQILSGRGGEI
jgi:hypothetical protein